MCLAEKASRVCSLFEGTGGFYFCPGEQNGKEGVNMDLFSYNWREKVEKEGPLASRMRPQSLDEFVGQREILARGGLRCGKP